MAVLVLFFDGIGVGSSDATRNPFASIGARRLAPLHGAPPEDGAAFRPLDATLGIPGLPQSATGQVSLYTGTNAARLLGRHQPGLPGPSLWPLLEERSLFVELVARGRRPTFANAFHRAHLEAKRPRFGATTRMVRASGLPFRMLGEEEPRGEALAHDYTGEWPARHGLSTTARTAVEAAAVLSRLTEAHDLVLYEYFLTDLAGHRGTPEERREQAARAERLVDAAVRSLDVLRHTLVVVSDHGNLEEADHDRHTRNPAPILAWGRDARSLVEKVDGFPDFAPAVAELAGTSLRVPPTALARPPRRYDGVYVDRENTSRGD